jgi:hypothetical protein
VIEDSVELVGLTGATPVAVDVEVPVVLVLVDIVVVVVVESGAHEAPDAHNLSVGQHPPPRLAGQL